MAETRLTAQRFAVIRSTFNARITDALLAGARRGFTDGGVPGDNLEVVDVPGAFELPLAALWLARSNRYAAIVALGCVIRGETPHFEYVAGEAARGLQRVMLDTGVPVAFGVLTVDNEIQARDRSQPVPQATGEHTGPATRGNKGYEAARVALAMAALRESLR